jgi:hypothetical protein
LTSGKSIHDFIYSAVAPARNHHASPLLDGLARNTNGSITARGRGKFGRNSRALQQAYGLLDFREAAMAPPPAGGVVDQQCVFDSFGHPVCPSLLKQTRIV